MQAERHWIPVMKCLHFDTRPRKSEHIKAHCSCDGPIVGLLRERLPPTTENLEMQNTEMYLSYLKYRFCQV